LKTFAFFLFLEISEFKQVKKKEKKTTDFTFQISDINQSLSNALFKLIHEENPVSSLNMKHMSVQSGNYSETKLL
jgi:hypothetical protein